jgi:hypothetical protein
LLSILSTPIFASHYVIGSLPPLLLLAAFGWTRYIKNWRAGILLTPLVAVASLSLLRYEPYRKVDWRSVAFYLEEREQATDCVLLVPGHLKALLDYYKRNSFCEWGATKLADLPAEVPSSVLFVIFATNDLSLPASTRAAFTDELRRGWREADRAEFWGVEVITFRH